MGKTVMITILQQMRGLYRHKLVKLIHKENSWWLMVGRTRHAGCDTTCFNTPGIKGLI